LGTLYEPSDNWWNLPVSNAPVDPNSGSIIATIQSYESTAGRLHPDFTPNYGIPYADRGQHDAAGARLDRQHDRERMGAPGGPLGYPIPVARRPTRGTSRIRAAPTAIATCCSTTATRAWRSSCHTHRTPAASGPPATVLCSSLIPTTAVPEGYTSTDAAGLCVLAGLVRYDEAYGTEPIRHAIRCSIRRTNRYVWPASHTGATDAGAPPLGMRMRLKASKDISGYPPEIRRIFQAMKDYGLIVADRGGNYVRAGHDGFALGQQHPQSRVPQSARE
jgi:hypothetical protein